MYKVYYGKTWVVPKVLRGGMIPHVVQLPMTWLTQAGDEVIRCLRCSDRKREFGQGTVKCIKTVLLACFPRLATTGIEDLRPQERQNLCDDYDGYQNFESVLGARNSITR
ncbi:hypothetical protein M378DRAFT_171188 [Amanita muscaria Koide BX008]|uniref:Uncharacterized protein n=1 Tax=Amanita muscaria (strain Koide BX008) TaxID=946122 RepID=A0A0C2WNS5_AMAMK|nr:hypothetical protein M378DRAFT_171188 [Amanita muscaria Koide BX008]